MDPVRELPYGPAASGAASEAGQMAASDYVKSFKKPLAFYGASTDGFLFSNADCSAARVSDVSICLDKA